LIPWKIELPYLVGVGVAALAVDFFAPDQFYVFLGVVAVISSAAIRLLVRRGRRPHLEEGQR
jgi:hypothetical protein